MRILIVSQYFWPESFVINEIAALLVRRGHAVTVLTGKPNYPGGAIFEGYQQFGVLDEDYRGVTLLRIPIYPRGKNSRIRLALNYLSFIVSASFFAPWALRGSKFDVVFVYGISPLLQALPAVLLSKLRRIPLVVWVQDLWPESLSATGHVRNSLVLRAVSWLVRLIYGSSDRILVQAEAFRASVSKYADPDKISYLPNPYFEGSSTRFSEAADALSQKLRRQFSVVFAGNIGAAQSLETIVGAAEKLMPRQDIKFFLVGSGSREGFLRSRIEELGLTNVELSGRFDSQDMAEVLSSASALLVTLTAAPIFALTIPSKLQAYLAAGRPIVAAINGESARIVREAGAGFAVSAENSEALADSIATLASLSDADRLAMGARGRAYFETYFSADMIADALVGHLDVQKSRVDQK